MGEIATWSAVKTKVGLGKDSNECPTKAELLALSPTGTGENYVGLEISNASSYGNNETVQLSDIHKVTYRYAFTVVDTVLNFPALGGYSTPRWFGLGTTKQKQIDGVAIGDTISVGYTKSAYPDWIVYDEGYKASENTTLNQRSASLTFTQNESGKQITVQFTQDAGVETWEYTFTSKNNSLVFNAIGGKGTPTELTITSNKQKYINGKAVGSPVNVDYSRPSLPSWLSVESGYYEALENKSESSRSYTDTLTQAESGKKLTPVLSQAAGVKTYGTPTVYLGSIADIPASGGTAATPTYTYSQLWGWNGKTDDGGTISSGALVWWSENILGSNLGTTAKARTKLGSRTLTVTLNGKSGSASIDVYQAENRITNVTQGAWVVSISANPSTFTEQGGTSQISASARASRTNHWSSGATNAASDATGTPTLSIPTAVTGFSLSGTTLTVAENKTANQRSVVVRATMDTVYKEVTVTQSAYLVEWRYTLTTSTPTLNFDALGTTKSGTISSYREKYINGSLVEGSLEGVNIQVKSTSAEIQSATAAVAITLKENTTTQARTGTVVYEQVGSGKTVTITCSQAAGTVAIREELVIKESFPTAPNIGGTVKALVRSGYWDVVNGKDTTWHDDTPTVKTKPSFVSSTSVTYELGVGYRISATMPENTSESQLSGSLNLEYGSKTLSLGVKQAGASVAWSYELKVNNGTQDLNQQVPAKPSGTYSFTISSKRYKIVNGSVTSQSEDTTWTTSIPGSPSWIHVEEQSNTLIVTVDENTTTSQRSADIVIFQTGSSDTSITLTVEQQAASITWNYTFNIFQPSSKVLKVPAKMIDPDTIVVNSYRTKVINGTQTSTKEFVEVTIDPIEESWLEVTKNSNDQTQAELFVTCLENKVSSIRSATVTIRQVGTSNLDQVDINQSAATVSYNYYIGFNGNPDVGGYSMNWEYTQFGSSHGQSIDLKCWRKPVINGIESDTEEAAEYEVIFSGVGIDSFTVTNTPLSYDPTITTVRAYPKSINGSVFDLKGTVQYRIADYPSKSAYLYLTHKPVATVKRWTFQWYDQVESVTIKNVSHDSSAGSISPITIISKCEYLLASNQSQVAYTEYIKPNEDEDTATPVSWGRLVENGQTAKNYYDYAYLVDENKEDYDRQTTRTFTQPGNPSNKRLYLYVTQTKPVTIKQEFHAALGNYYSYNDSNQIPLIYQWYSPDSSGTTNIGDMTPGGYLGVWCNLPATGVINCMITGKPQTGKPMKARLSNLQARTIENFDSGSPTEINKGLSVGYSQQDYRIGIEYSPGMNNYFLITPSILPEAGAYGGGIRLEVSLRSSYSNNGTTIATVTLTPKNSDHPTIYFEVIYG
nr:MAG: Putative binding domain, N-terminal [Bacteriophage sp.]